MNRDLALALALGFGILLGAACLVGIGLLSVALGMLT